MKPRALPLTLLLFTVGCQLGGGPININDLPTPFTSQVSAPDVEDAASDYLDAWAAFDYQTMYNLLTTLSKDGISYEDFEERYHHIRSEANLATIEYEILQTLVSPYSAQVGYRVTLQSAIVGPITRDTSMELSRQSNEEWRVIWDDRLILPELTPTNKLSMDRFNPSRGNIYDQHGNAIAFDSDAYALTVIPSGIGEEDGGGLTSALARAVGLPSYYFQNILFIEEPEFFIPVGEVSASDFNQWESALDDYGTSLRWENYPTRFYPSMGVGPQVIGYFGTIPAEECEELIAKGYRCDDKIGRIGIERWGEELLFGKRGGKLYVVDQDFNIVTQLEESEAEASKSIYTTLDQDLQIQAQLAIKDYVGAVVVLERDTGRILAMVSSPGFNPNAADFGNYNGQFQWSDYVNDSNQPFFNRATQGQYPPGSIFKPITLAAALESGLYASDHVYNCTHTWTGLPGVELVDWTLEKELPASGNLTILEGLMRSCNTYFYDIGLSLYSRDLPTIVADMARDFGLGSPTGFEQLPEEAGQVTNPDDDEELSSPAFQAVQQAIGQGTTLLTPLQAAVYVAALGNGGTLYRPQIIERIESTDGSIESEFTPIENGTLPISESTITNIQTAMRMVVANGRGTAYRSFRGEAIPVAGKTGTASVGVAESLPHAWFIGYTFAERENLPDIAIAVLVENVGDGSEFAAPIFRRITDVYFLGNPQVRYEWEARIGVVATEEPEDEDEEAEATPEP